MIVKIGNKFYTGAEEPIMIILDDEEKGLISMSDNNSFCSYPEGYTEEEITKFMEEEPADETV